MSLELEEENRKRLLAEERTEDQLKQMALNTRNPNKRPLENGEQNEDPSKSPSSVEKKRKRKESKKNEMQANGTDKSSSSDSEEEPSDKEGENAGKSDGSNEKPGERNEPMVCDGSNESSTDGLSKGGDQLSSQTSVELSTEKSSDKPNEEVNGTQANGTQSDGTSPNDGDKAGKESSSQAAETAKEAKLRMMEQMKSIMGAIRAVPKLISKKCNTLPVWIECLAERSEIHEWLLQPANAESNIFRRIIPVKAPEILLVILNQPDQLKQLEGLLVGRRAKIHRRNPMQRTTGRRVIVIDFAAKSMKPAELKQTIIKQNGGPQDFSVWKVYEKTVPTCAIIECNSEKCYEEFCRKDFIHIEASTAEVRRYYPLDLCHGCCQFEHTVEHCPHPQIKICLLCAATGHTADDCTAASKGRKRCFNCKVAGYDSRHYASTVSCPFRLALMENRCSKAKE